MEELEQSFNSLTAIQISSKGGKINKIINSLFLQATRSTFSPKPTISSSLGNLKQSTEKLPTLQTNNIIILFKCCNIYERSLYSKLGNIFTRRGMSSVWESPRPLPSHDFGVKIPLRDHCDLSPFTILQSQHCWYIP